MITIGIDPHKSSLTAVALQPSGEVSATIRLEVNCDTVARLRAWARQWSQRQWAVEGAAGLGRGVAQGLAAADEPVVDVPAQLAARARREASVPDDIEFATKPALACGRREPCHVMRPGRTGVEGRQADLVGVRGWPQRNLTVCRVRAGADAVIGEVGGC